MACGFLAQGLSQSKPVPTAVEPTSHHPRHDRCAAICALDRMRTAMVRRRSAAAGARFGGAFGGIAAEDVGQRSLTPQAALARAHVLDGAPGARVAVWRHPACAGEAVEAVER